MQGSRQRHIVIDCVEDAKRKNTHPAACHGRITDDLRRDRMKLAYLLFWGALAAFFVQAVFSLHRLAGQVGDGLARVVGQ